MKLAFQHFDLLLLRESSFVKRPPALTPRLCYLSFCDQVLFPITLFTDRVNLVFLNNGSRHLTTALRGQPHVKDLLIDPADRVLAASVHFSKSYIVRNGTKFAET